MSDSTSQALALFQECTPLFQALGEPVRQELIVMLGQHESLNVNQMAQQSPMSRPTISHHLKILRQAGLVTVTKKGTESYYTLQLDDFVAQMKQLIHVVEEACIWEDK